MLSAMEEYYGTLAATRLDIRLHLWHGVRVVSPAVYAGLRLGEGSGFLMNRQEPSPPDRAGLAAQLERHGQAHLLRFWDEMDAAGRARLARQIAAIDLPQIAELFRRANESHHWGARARRAAPPPAVRMTDRGATKGGAP